MATFHFALSFTGYEKWTLNVKLRRQWLSQNDKTANYCFLTEEYKKEITGHYGHHCRCVLPRKNHRDNEILHRDWPALPTRSIYFFPSWHDAKNSTERINSLGWVVLLHLSIFTSFSSYRFAFLWLLQYLLSSRTNGNKNKLVKFFANSVREIYFFKWLMKYVPSNFGIVFENGSNYIWINTMWIIIMV